MVHFFLKLEFSFPLPLPADLLCRLAASARHISISASSSASGTLLLLFSTSTSSPPPNAPRLMTLSPSLRMLSWHITSPHTSSKSISLPSIGAVHVSRAAVRVGAASLFAFSFILRNVFAVRGKCGEAFLLFSLENSSAIVRVCSAPGSKVSDVNHTHTLFFLSFLPLSPSNLEGVRVNHRSISSGRQNSSPTSTPSDVPDDPTPQHPP